MPDQVLCHRFYSAQDCGTGRAEEDLLGGIVTLMSESSEAHTAVLTISERLLGIVRQILGPNFASRPLPIDARLADIGMTSIKMVNLMLSVEAEFDITIPQAQINPENFASVASIEALLSRMLTAA
jgi:acyl carrier protein